MPADFDNEYGFTPLSLDDGTHSSPHDHAFDPGTAWSPLRPINWNLLTAEEAEAEWLDLNAWVNWLRRTYGLPPAIIPPFWHRHDELVWELSALHQHWLACYSPDAPASSPLAWHHDFAEARHRLRDWVALSGTRLDRDRPTRQTAWPGEDPIEPEPDRVIEHRDRDFLRFVVEDIQRRNTRHTEGTTPS